MQTKLAIIVPIFNKEKYLTQTLTSILASVFGLSVSVILIDDESTDGSTEIALQYTKMYPNIFQYYRIKHQGGYNPCHARNAGTEIINSEYVLYFDADDILLSGYPERAIQYLDEHPECNYYIESEYTYELTRPQDSCYNNCNINEHCDNYLPKIAIKCPIMLYGVMRTNLVKKMSERYGLFDSDRWEDIKFTAKYLLIFGGLHVEVEKVARIHYAETGNSVAVIQAAEQYYDQEEVWENYMRYLNEKFVGTDFYCRWNDELGWYESYVPETAAYFE